MNNEAALIVFLGQNGDVVDIHLILWLCSCPRVTIFDLTHFLDPGQLVDFRDMSLQDFDLFQLELI